MKKASANMWWIIIGAVIALVVMIILMVMFTGKTRPLEEGLSSCEGKGGICISENDVCPKNTLKSTVFDCQPSWFCCLGTPKQYVDQQGCPGGPVTDVQGKSWCK